MLDAARISRPKLEGQLLFIDYVGREVPGPKPNRWLTVSNIPEGANARDVAVAVTAWSDNVRMCAFGISSILSSPLTVLLMPNDRRTCGG